MIKFSCDIFWYRDIIFFYKYYVFFLKKKIENKVYVWF